MQLCMHFQVHCTDPVAGEVWQGARLVAAGHGHVVRRDAVFGELDRSLTIGSSRSESLSRPSLDL